MTRPRRPIITKELIDPNLSLSYRNLLIGIVYNKNVIKPEMLQLP
jgi:hypothetical protein